MIEAVQMMLTSVHNLVSISTELLLKTVIKLYGEQYLKLTSNEETPIISNFGDIALPKN
jgi:hypothetical protein